MSSRVSQSVSPQTAQASTGAKLGRQARLIVELLLSGRGAVRAVELTGHPFFVATLFQPERAVFAGRSHP